MVPCLVQMSERSFAVLLFSDFTSDNPRARREETLGWFVSTALSRDDSEPFVLL